MIQTCKSCGFSGSSELFGTFSDKDGYHEVCSLCRNVGLYEHPRSSEPMNVRQTIVFVGNRILEEIGELKDRIKALEGK